MFAPSSQGGRENLPVTECGIRVSWLILWAKIVEQKLGPDVTTAEVCAKFVSHCWHSWPMLVIKALPFCATGYRLQKKKASCDTQHFPGKVP
eukprot:scaffold272092_cov22-Tisochrysis_lutea.AAC.2